MNSLNKIFSLCFAISCFALAYFFYSSSNIPEGMFEDPKTGMAMLLGQVSIDELKPVSYTHLTLPTKRIV